MKNTRIIIPMWGIFDICALAWFFGRAISRGDLPFFHDISAALTTGKAVGIPLVTVSITVVSLIMYLSLIFSGIYLIKQKKEGAIISYVQAPFRILLLIPPSIFFIHWPLKFMMSNQNQNFIVSAGILLTILTEGIKLWSITRWRKSVSGA